MDSNRIEYENISRKIQTQGAVGIHIRRGDYLALYENFGILSIGYYEKALKALGMDGNSAICLASDDMEFAKSFLSNLFPEMERIYLEDFTPLESMMLLGQCKRICISNSTYGYWAAMLGNPEVVVAPKKWFRNLPDPLDLLPESWLLQESEWED